MSCSVMSQFLKKDPGTYQIYIIFLYLAGEEDEVMEEQGQDHGSLEIEILQIEKPKLMWNWQSLKTGPKRALLRAIAQFETRKII